MRKQLLIGAVATLLNASAVGIANAGIPSYENELFHNSFSNVNSTSYGNNFFIGTEETDLVYSDVILTSITPNPEEYFNEFPTQVTVAFSDEVNVSSIRFRNISGMERPNPINDYTLDDTKKQLMINLTEPLGGTACFTVMISATDKDGKALSYGENEGIITLVYTASPDSFKPESITPAEGEMDSLKTFTLEEFGSDFIGFIDTTKTVVLKNEYNETVTTGSISGKEYTPVVIVTLENEITEPGTYTLVIPEKTVFDNMYDGSMEDFGVSMGATYNPELTYEYTIKPVYSDVTLTSITPDPKNYFNEFPTQVTVAFSDEVNVSSIRFRNISGMERPNPINDYTLDDTKKQLMINLTEPLGGTACFTVMISATDKDGKALSYGENEGIITLVYTASPDSFKPESITPAEGEVDILKTFTLEEFGSDFIGFIDTTKTVVLKNEYNETVTTGSISGKEYTPVVIVTLENEITEPGTYTLVIPEKIVFDNMYDGSMEDFGVSMGATYNPELTYEYTIKPVYSDVTLTSITPDPKNYFKEFPTQVTVAFSDEVNVSSVIFKNLSGWGSDIINDYTLDDTKKQLTIKLTEPLGGTACFIVMISATDKDGKILSYGESESFIMLVYTTSPDSFKPESITPAEGEVDSLKTFTLEEFGSDFIGFIDTTKTVVLKNEYNETVTTGSISGKEYTPVVIVTLENEITEPGTYTLVIPEKTVFDNMYDGSMEDFGVSMGATYNPELTYEYTIKPVYSDVTLTSITPDPKNYFKEFPTQVTVAFSDEVNVSSVIFKNLSGWGSDIINDYTLDDTKKQLTIKLTEPLGGTACFIVMISATDKDGKILSYGESEGFIMLVYNVSPDSFKPGSITPAEGEIASLSTFILNDFEDMIGGFDPSKTTVLKDESGNIVTTGTLYADIQNWGTNVTVTLEQEITEAGTYTLVIPEATIYNSFFYEEDDDFGVANGAIYNPELTYTYTVNGNSSNIDAILNDITGEVTVYNLQGIAIRTADASEVLKGLAKGIYIINGKKVVIK